MPPNNAVRALSRALFHNLYALEVAAAISDFSDGTFTQTALARKLAVDRNLVALVVRRLEAGGLVKRLPDAGLERPFLRQPSQFWGLAARLVKETQG